MQRLTPAQASQHDPTKDPQLLFAMRGKLKNKNLTYSYEMAAHFFIEANIFFA